jgi:hypothetical protein
LVRACTAKEVNGDGSSTGGDDDDDDDDDDNIDFSAAPVAAQASSLVALATTAVFGAFAARRTL